MDFRFNAYAIHHDPESGDPFYQSLYPADPTKPEVKGADFHYLNGFKPIDLSKIGLKQSQSRSKMWKDAVSKDKNFKLK